MGQVRTAASARGGVPQAGMRAFWSRRLVLSGVGSRRWAEWHSGAGGPVWAACKRGAAARDADAPGVQGIAARSSYASDAGQEFSALVRGQVWSAYNSTATACPRLLLL